MTSRPTECDFGGCDSAWVRRHSKCEHNKGLLWVNSDLDCPRTWKTAHQVSAFCLAQPPIAEFYRGICILSQCWPPICDSDCFSGATEKQVCSSCVVLLFLALGNYWVCLHRLCLRALLTSLTVDLSQKYRFPGRYWKTLLGVGRVIKFSWIITNFMVDQCVYWNRWYLYSARRCVWWCFITALRCITRKI